MKKAYEYFANKHIKGMPSARKSTNDPQPSTRKESQQQNHKSSEKIHMNLNNNGITNTHSIKNSKSNKASELVK
jgi:hypothetical protein